MKKIMIILVLVLIFSAVSTIAIVEEQETEKCECEQTDETKVKLLEKCNFKFPASGTYAINSPFPPSGKQLFNFWYGCRLDNGACDGLTKEECKIPCVLNCYCMVQKAFQWGSPNAHWSTIFSWSPSIDSQCKFTGDSK